MELPEYSKKIGSEETQPEQTSMTTDDFFRGVAGNVENVRKLMKQHFTYRTPSLFPYYHELSDMQQSKRGFGETNNKGSKFTFVHSVPYGRQPTDSKKTFLYQRLGAYYQGGKILALVHLIDPGDAIGPGTSTDAFLNVGALRSVTGSTLIWFSAQEGPVQKTDAEDIQDVYDNFVVNEFEELQATHIRESAVSFSDRNYVQPFAKTFGALTAFGRIAMGKEKAE